MTTSMLPLPAEPTALRALARAALEQAPESALPLVVSGEWIADPLWEGWRDALEPRGMDRRQFDGIIAGYGNELRLWVVGERPWNQYVSGIAGRVTRRISPQRMPGPRAPWEQALARIGVTPDHSLAALVTVVAELCLLYEVAAPNDAGSQAIVWAGARPRDPEAPTGEGQGPTPATALAEALGRFLLKDPAYPPRWSNALAWCRPDEGVVSSRPQEGHRPPQA